MDKHQALFAFYDARKHTPFVWGQSDCALLAADWLKSYNGVDYAAPFRGRYKTYLGSKRAMSKLGFQSLYEVVFAQLGEPLSSPLLAQRGDIVIVETDIGEAVGIADGHGVMAQDSEGIEHVPLSQVKTAWRVK